jgi:hypothetical protein
LGHVACASSPFHGYQSTVTVHLENIQTALLFPHFVTLQPYSEMYNNVKHLIILHTTPHKEKVKTGF